MRLTLFGQGQNFLHRGEGKPGGESRPRCSQRSRLQGDAQYNGLLVPDKHVPLFMRRMAP
jgi:hypothetical protein